MDLLVSQVAEVKRVNLALVLISLVQRVYLAQLEILVTQAVQVLLG